MNVENGVVEKIHQNAKAYNIVVDGDWYGYGWLNDGAPDFNEGDSISFEYEKKGRFSQIKKETIKKSQGTPKKASSGGGSFDNRQLSIQYQSARNAAIETVNMLVVAGLVPLPAKKAASYEAAMSLIDDLTAKYHNDVDTVVENGGLVLEDLSAFEQPDELEE